MSKIVWDRKGLYYSSNLTVYHRGILEMEIKAVIWSPELKQRPRIFTDSSSWLAQPASLYYPGPPAQEWHLPQ